MAEVATVAGPVARPLWPVVASRELRDLWLSGRGTALILAHTTLLSVTTYLVASNQELNFLEQREAVSLTLQVAVAVGGLLVVLGAADAFSGERERGSLESLLLTPVPRRALVIGKGLSALSLWVTAFTFSVPYLWWLGRDVGTFHVAVVNGFVVGSLLALFVAGLGLLVSMFSSSNGLSLAVSFFVLLALYAPNQMPGNALRGWAGELLLRIDPFTSGLLYLDRLIINGHSFSQEAGLLISPLVAAVAVPVVALISARRLSLLPWER
jgi:ABC-2 type transport system permease protein